ncbi:uncharacterized protein LOC127264310 [Andrographis paniculata]|uniref:uncharacterized protein LOC127264310 n=1 Tax=Andrographis paniculata TaxID=175694 RepID=UPI0021E93758|nr:uncharacterized protein LOC127264310 [Andrographis paniculata]
MAFPAATALTASRFPIAPFKQRLCRPDGSFLINVHRKHLSVACFAKFPRMEHFPDSTKFVTFLNYTKDKLWEFVPGSVKQFPWKNATNVALRDLQALGKKTLKWTLLAYFALSCPSDIVYSLSGNKDLMIPLGLIIGCVMANYFDDISKEVMSNYKGDNAFTWKLVGLSCFFVLVKAFSFYVLRANDLVLHVGNGGLMQLLWNWKNLPKLEEENSSSEDAVATAIAKTDD